MLVNFYPPPLRGVAAAAQGSASDYLRRQWIAVAWRRSSVFQKAVFVLSIVVWWPGTVLIAAYLAMRLGPSRKRISGKSPFRQFIEQLVVAARWIVPPKWYYIFEFFDDARRAQAGQYLQRVQTKPFIFHWLVDRVDRRIRYPFNNKAFFADLCRSKGLPTCPVLALVGETFQFTAEGMTDLPPTDLFVKIRKGRGGKGAEKWRHEQGHYVNGSGRKLTGPALMRDLENRSSRRLGRIVQPCFRNHSQLSDLNLGALATVRVMTIRGAAADIEATHAVFRMPRVQGSCVDNLHAGGIAAAVDLATGRLGRATDLGIRVDSRWHAAHPVTGAPIEGRILPHWPAVLELAARAHRLIGDRVVVGWDIAILEEGPCLVEGNGKPDVDIIQRPHRQGLCETRFGDLLALHLAEHLAGNPLNGRPAAPLAAPLVEGAAAHS